MLEDAFALKGVGDFRVKLDAVEFFGFIGHAGDRTARGGGHDVEVRRQFDDFVAVAHPDVQQGVAVVVEVVFDVVQQLSLAVNLDLGVAKFLDFGALYGAAQLFGHGLHAVADAEYGHAELEDGLRCSRAAFGVDGFGATSEDDAVGVVVPDFLVAHVEGADFGEDADFADSSGDELGVLGAEVEDEDSLGVDVLSHGGS